MIALLLLLLAQDADLETLVAQLDHDDAAVREKASAGLIERGTAIVPRLLALQRSATSAELRTRAEDILTHFPFESLVRTQPGEPLREKLITILLKDLEEHRETPGCWLPKDRRPEFDPARLSILWQIGSGHGQFLAIVRIVSNDQGCFDVRRIAYQGTTPYRAQVKAAGVKAEESRFDREESVALAELLQAGVVLESKCARPQEPGRSWMSTGSFSMRFRIESRGSVVWNAAYTGYPGSTGLPLYAHGKVIDDALWKILRNRPWTESKIVPEDRVLALRWMTDNQATESWWVKEHYLHMARFIGDESFRPFLQKVVQEVEGKDGPSEKRQLEAARAALSGLRPVEK